MKKTRTMVTILLDTAIRGTKTDNDNRKALKALAKVLGVALSNQITISPRNSKGHYNTGEIVECIVRIAYGANGDKQSRGSADLIANDEIIEIKSVNRDGKPTQTKGLNPNTKTLIVANVASFERGIYSLAYGEIVWNSSSTPHMVISETLKKAKLVKAF